MPEEIQIDLEHFRQILLDEKRRLNGYLARPEDNAEENQSGDQVADLSDYPDHSADFDTETFEREKEMTLKQNARDLLEEVSEALRKINNGTYGICASCKKPIPERRLEAKPSAIYCVSCQSMLEGV